MTGGTEASEYPPVEGGAYELRLTRRALDDLGCPPDIAPGDLTDIADHTEQRALVTKFASLRRSAPTGTDGPMRNVGRPDVYSLHGFAGDRACTWFDRDAQICWLLGWVAEHNYAEFESRAVNGDLLPDEEDYTILEVEREELDFIHRVGPGVRTMLGEALQTPSRSVRRTVGALLCLDVSVVVEQVGEHRLVDIYIAVRVPPLDAPPPGWPGRELPTRLAELVTGVEARDLTIDVPQLVPDGAGDPRSIDFANELAVVIRSHVLESPDGP